MVQNYLKRQVWSKVGRWMEFKVKKIRNLMLEEQKKQARVIDWGARQIVNMGRLHQRMYVSRG